MSKFYSAPRPGDIVQCRFPQDRIRQPGPKERPALVTEVEEYELANGELEVFVTVAYGTSESVDRRYPGEFKIDCSDPHAGLGLDTKFDLGKRVKLPFDEDWFAPWARGRFGVHPRRGKLDMHNDKLKRGLSSAIAELRKSRRGKVDDMSPRPVGRRKR